MLLIGLKCRFRSGWYELQPLLQSTTHISLSHKTFYGFYVPSRVLHRIFFFSIRLFQIIIVLLALAQL